jgi:transcriptional regulator with XRE-family HTH domain
MRSADLLLAGRRRASLTQAQLAERLGCPQATIARWEAGHQHPPLERVIEALHACGLELTVGMVRYDDSYDAQIARQLRLAPAERVRRLSPAWVAEGFDPLEILGRLVGHARFVVVGDVAGALQGWPIMLGARTLEVLIADTAIGRIEQTMARLDGRLAEDAPAGQSRWLLPDGGELRASISAAGTRGYSDLVRDAALVEVVPGRRVRVASLIDLIRMAEASPDPEARVHVPALWATLELCQRADVASEAA